MKLQGFADQFQGWLVTELAAQRALSALVDRQLDAIRAGDAEGMAVLVAEVDQRLKDGKPHEIRRALLVERFAEGAGIARKEATIARILDVLDERGVATQRLRELRAELRDTIAELLKKNRRVTALARYHRGLLDEVLRAIAGSSGDAAAASGSGALVNAEV